MKNSRRSKTSVCPVSSYILKLLFFFFMPAVPLFFRFPGADPGINASDPAREFRTGSFPEFQRLSVDTVSREERDLVIYLFEQRYPEKCRGLLRFFRRARLKTGADHSEDIRNIKYLVYLAPDPWRSLFLDRIGHVRLVDSSGRQLCRGILLKTVYVDLDRAASDPKGSYKTFFHECAHGIGCPGGLHSLSVPLRSDAADRFLPALAAAESGRSLFSGEAGDPRCFFISFSPEEDLLSDMLSAFRETDGSPEIKISGYTHTSSYWNTPGMPEKEFFAGYLSLQFAGDRDLLVRIDDPDRGLFPRSAACLSALVSDSL